MTIIFESRVKFLARENIRVNGVSPEFAAEHPDYETDNSTNVGCWNCYSCSRCYKCVNCIDCIGCQDCESCVGSMVLSSCRECSNCHNCRSCTTCKVCADCVDCSDCTFCFESRSRHGSEGFVVDHMLDVPVPIVKDIHQEIYRAVSEGGTLNMNQWHGAHESTCDSTHCRAGWAIHLAGAPGYDLERLTKPLYAAMLIYGKSSSIPVRPHIFYATNDVAINDMKRCAELERNHNLGSVAEGLPQAGLK